MNKIKLFWTIFWVLLLAPVTKSFFINVNLMIKGYVINNQYVNLFQEILAENNNLKNKVKYYSTPNGYRSLIKERLEKLDDGEILIKYKE